MKDYQIPLEQLFKNLDSNINGLNSEIAAARLLKEGKNILKKEKKHNVFFLFLQQFKNIMTIILLAAAVLSGYLGGWAEMIIIIIVILANAFIGVIQEAKAEKAIEALQKLSEQQVRAQRDGKELFIPSSDLVIGDVIYLSAGDNVPADCRLIETHSLQAVEASLTGESMAIEKSCRIITGDHPLGDLNNMVFMGTSISYGRGKAIVTATGMNTEMGKIAHILNTTKTEATPLQKQLGKIGEFLSVAIICICAGMFIINTLRPTTAHLSKDFENKILNNFMLSISLAVAAIPEGLTAVITLVLSLGVMRMSKKKAIIRKLPAIEALGCVEVICSDKTGTLTENRMKIVKTYLSDMAGDQTKFLEAMTACNDASLSTSSVSGDPTEIALLEYAKLQGFEKRSFDKANPRIGEIPFDSNRKMMSTIIKNKQGCFLYTKGAVDILLGQCDKLLIDNQECELTIADKNNILNENNMMASQALRVLAVAYCRIDEKKEYQEHDERNLTFIGLIGMIDPIRKEVIDAVYKAKNAGVRTIMITGDHLITAVAIGRELGLLRNEKEAMTGKELDNLSDEEFNRQINHINVFARVSPENKVRIVRTLKNQGRIVAMTGDGVNDAPAIKSADIGIGMGIVGTDVTKSVADVVLADDNFNTIVVAVEEGRKIYENIKKSVQFLLSSNVCEVLTILIASLLGFEILTPVMLLWVNLVTDTVPAVALGLENADDDIMDEKPRKSNKSIFSDGVGINIVYQSILLTLLVLAAYYVGNNIIKDHQIGETMAFMTLALSQIFHSFNLKSMRKSILNERLFANKLLTYGSIGVFIATITIIYLPGINSGFGLKALTPGQLLISVGLAMAIIPLVELVKLLNKIIRVY